MTDSTQVYPLFMRFILITNLSNAKEKARYQSPIMYDSPSIYRCNNNVFTACNIVFTTELDWSSTSIWLCLFKNKNHRNFIKRCEGMRRSPKQLRWWINNKCPNNKKGRYTPFRSTTMLCEAKSINFLLGLRYDAWTALLISTWLHAKAQKNNFNLIDTKKCSHSHS